MFSLCPPLWGGGLPPFSPNGKGGFPILPNGGSTPILLDRRYPIWLTGGTPHQDWMGVAPTPLGLDGGNPPPPLGLGGGTPTPQSGVRAAERTLAMRRAVCLLR